MSKKKYVEVSSVTGNETPVFEVKTDNSQLKHLIREVEGTRSAMVMLGLREQILKYLKELI